MQRVTAFLWLTLEGQYIIKNLTLIAAGIVVGATVTHESDETQGVVSHANVDKRQS